MRAYWAVGVSAFRRFATYRGATIAGVFTNTIFGFIYADVFRAVYTTRAEVGRASITDSSPTLTPGCKTATGSSPSWASSARKTAN